MMENSAMGASWQGIGVFFFMTNKDTSYKFAPAGGLTSIAILFATVI
jgi:hypothetical protein